MKKVKKKKGKKFCPKCGAQINLSDAYCTHCGYSFVRKKKSNKKQLIIVLITLLILFGLLRIFLNKPLIPTEIIDFFKNLFNFSAG